MVLDQVTTRAVHPLLDDTDSENDDIDYEGER